MIELKRNKKTGIVESWKNGKKIGEVITMGDEVDGRRDSKDNRQHSESNRGNR